MKKILLVKITSMGDLIQQLPALTDASRAIPGIQFDWVVEESFQEIPRLHPSVKSLILLPYRRWKRNLRQSIQTGEIKRFYQALRHQSYDMIIDAQSNLKSAFVTTCARGKKYGVDKTSVREYGAHWAYHEKVNINRQQNHGFRMRQLLAKVLDYPLPNTPPDYGINLSTLPTLSFELPKPFIFLTTICSSRERLWPEPYWQHVIREILPLGFHIVLPWWSEEEKARALRLKGDHSSVHLLPSLNLAEKARVLSQATAAISVDTGLAHMAAALNVPNVGLYGPTDARFTGSYGAQQIHLSASGPACAPCLRTNCTYQGASEHYPACLETIKPPQVLQAFHQLLQNSSNASNASAAYMSEGPPPI